MKKKIFYGILATLLIIQAFQTDKTNPAVEKDKDFIAMKQPPADVEKMLRAACYDCHSNETVWPWYTYVNPVGWWIGAHVRNGRRHLNFSSWGAYDAEKQAHKLEECEEEVKEGKMPLKSYVAGHSEAKLTPEQRTALAAWFATL